jgi:glutamate--cysteine ligase
MARDHENSFVKFVRAQSEKTKAYFQTVPFSDEQQARFTLLSQQSIADQKKIEAGDSMPFEIYREQYVSAERLNVPEKAGKEPVLST